MIDTFLFDLDGTLLPLDMEKFTEIYFTQMGKAFADIIDPGILVKYIWISTDAMIKNDGSKTNHEAFMKVFGNLVKDDIEVFVQRFDRFYDEGFLETKKASVVSPSIKDAVALLKGKGLDLIIATNPIFPQKAVYHRIKWAGLDPEDFIYITSYEKCGYCKPDPGFYGEVLEKTGKKPQNCIMVGNDVQEDLIASVHGISTYLINDHMINRNDQEIVCDHTGSYEDFYHFVKKTIEKM